MGGVNIGLKWGVKFGWKSTALTTWAASNAAPTVLPTILPVGVAGTVAVSASALCQNCIFIFFCSLNPCQAESYRSDKIFGTKGYKNWEQVYKRGWIAEFDHAPSKSWRRDNTTVNYSFACFYDFASGALASDTLVSCAPH